MKTTFIYELSDPRTGEPRYIGKTKNPKRRLYEHIHNLKTNNYRVNWIKSLLKQNLEPVMTIIEECSENEWQNSERIYISLYKSWGFSLTNYLSGGEGLSEETSKLISNKLKGKIQDKKIVNKRIESRRKFYKEKGFWAKPGTYEKASKTRRDNNIPWSEESRQKASQTRKDKLFSGEIKLHEKFIKNQKGKKGKDNNAARQIVQYDLSGNYVKQWDCIKFAKLIGFTGDIIGCCTGRCFQSKGFIWRYLNPNFDELPNTLESIKETLLKIELRKEFIKNNLREKQQLAVKLRKGSKMSIESREKMSKAKIGKEPWNKGLKGKQVAWNKGLKTKLIDN